MSSQSNNQSPLEPFRKDIEKLVEQVRSKDPQVSPTRDIVEFMAHHHVPVSPRAVQRALKRWSLTTSNQGARPKTEIKGDKATVVGRPEDASNPIGDVARLLEERGLSPEDWDVDTVKVNEWDSPSGETLRQLTANLRRHVPLAQIVAPRTDGWIAPKKIKPAAGRDEARLVVIVGDQQAPFHDPALHSAFLAWLEYNRPDEGVLLGDTVDFPNISRHRLDPENAASVNECLQSGYDILRGYVEASPNTSWKKMPGNHDERIRNLLLDKPKAQPLYGIKRPDTPDGDGERVLEIPHLLRLDELDIEWVDPHGQYDMAQVDLSAKLAVRHGWIARKDAGASAMESLKHTGYSIVVGHTHRQGIVHKTSYDIKDYPTVLTAVETGCMCRLDVEVQKDDRRFPNFTPLPDWQQGFATAFIWPDGKFKIDLATFVNGELIYQDQRYR